MYEVGTYNSEPVAACGSSAKGKEAAAVAAAVARGKVAAAAKPFFERQRNESRVGGGPHGDLL